MTAMLKRPKDAPQCSACDERMELTVLIPPFGSPYGLKVFSCPRCGRSQDVLVMAA
jgi:predicted RNA-binding Zn-ribbon protein involved in translation (DUF1610 family)